MDSFQQARLAQSLVYQTLNLRVVGSSPTVGKNFAFCRVRRAPGRLAGPMQTKSSMAFIRRNIGAKRELSFERKMAEVLVPNTRKIKRVHTSFNLNDSTCIPKNAFVA